MFDLHELLSQSLGCDLVDYNNEQYKSSPLGVSIRLVFYYYFSNVCFLFINPLKCIIMQHTHLDLVVNLL